MMNLMILKILKKHKFLIKMKNKYNHNNNNKQINKKTHKYK